MGRRRNIGEARSAGAGRVCTHPRRALEFAPDGQTIIRARCRRCGQLLFGSEAHLLRPRPRDKPRLPARKG